MEEGTARNLKTDAYNFAGKTGTAQVNYKKLENTTRVGGYQASFAGYFPAENPVYSCIVVVNNPRAHGNYGGEVAGPIFRKIADECYSTELQLHEALEPVDPSLPIAGRKLPGFDIGYREDMGMILNELSIPFEGAPSEDIAVVQTKSDTLTFVDRTMSTEVVPTVTGLGLKDALYVLENRGLKVKVDGVGKVSRQSLIPGTPIRGQEITLYLN